MTPIKITLQKTSTHLNLVVAMTGTKKGYVVIDGTPISASGPKEKTLTSLRKHGASYAKRFNISFIDQTASL